MLRACCPAEAQNHFIAGTGSFCESSWHSFLSAEALLAQTKAQEVSLLTNRVNINVNSF